MNAYSDGTKLMPRKSKDHKEQQCQGELLSKRAAHVLIIPQQLPFSKLPP